MQISSAIELLEKHGIERANENIEHHIQRLAALANHGLNSDLVLFYQSMKGGWLFDGEFRLLPLSEVENVGWVQGGEFGRLSTPPHWVAIMDAMDGNYIAIDLISGKILDCDHEELGKARVIAFSLWDFFIKFFSAAPNKFWLEEDFVAIDSLIHPPSDELNRHTYRDFWEMLGDESGSEVCTTSGCSRFRIALSVKCRKHHYEMVRSHSCPFK